MVVFEVECSYLDLIEELRNSKNLWGVVDLCNLYVCIKIFVI